MYRYHRENLHSNYFWELKGYTLSYDPHKLSMSLIIAWCGMFSRALILVSNVPMFLLIEGFSVNFNAVFIDYREWTGCAHESSLGETC